MNKRLLFLITFWALLGSMITAQEARNPFDLPSTDETELESATIERSPNDNPFDLQPQASSGISNEGAQVREKKEIPKISVSDQGTNIALSLFLIIPLALLMTLFRGVFNDFLEAGYRDRKFNQFFRRPNSMWVIPNILLYTFFFISIGVFLYLTLTYYGYGIVDNAAKSIGLLTLSIIGFFAIKHAVLYFLGNTFDVMNEAKRYSLLILTYNIILGVFLTPINLLLLLGPESLRGGVVIFGIIVIAGMVLMFMLRSLSLANRLLLQHTLHFFMYLCTIEIAPLFIVAKLLS